MPILKHLNEKIQIIHLFQKRYCGPEKYTGRNFPTNEVVCIIIPHFVNGPLPLKMLDCQSLDDTWLGGRNPLFQHSILVNYTKV